jgi:fatty acid desaturase
LFIKGWGWSVNLEHIVQQYSMAIIQNVCVGEWVGWVAKWGMRYYITIIWLHLSLFNNACTATIFHYCTHYALFRSKIANTIIGYITDIFFWHGFKEWIRTHTGHHNNVMNLNQKNPLDYDDAFSRQFHSDKQYSFGQQIFIKHILRYGIIALKSFVSLCVNGQIILLILILIYNTLLCYLCQASNVIDIIFVVFFIYVLPILFATSFFTKITALQHYSNEDSILMNANTDDARYIKWSHVRCVLSATFLAMQPKSINRDIFSFILMYILGDIVTSETLYHVAHHLDYSIPCYNLSQATRIMKRCLQELANGEYRELTDDAIQALRNEQPLDMDSDGYISSKYRVSTEDSLYYSRRYEFILTDSQGEPVRDNRGRAIEYGSPVRTDVDGNKVEVIVTPFVNRKECNHPSHASDLKKTYAYCVHAVDGELELGNGVKAKYINKEDVIITQYNMRENPADINAWKMMWVNFEWNTDELRFLSFEEVITRKLEGASEWKKRWCFRMSRMLGMVG